MRAHYTARPEYTKAMEQPLLYTTSSSLLQAEHGSKTYPDPEPAVTSLSLSLSLSLIPSSARSSPTALTSGSSGSDMQPLAVKLLSKPSAGNTSSQPLSTL